MGGFFANPLVQSVLIPVLGGFLLTGAIRFANGPSRGPLVAGASVALGFLIGYGLILNLPPLPPVSANQKLAYVVAAGLVLGFLLDFLRRPPFWRELVYVAGTAAALYWIAKPPSGADAWTLLGLIALWLAVLILGYRLEKGRAAVLVPCVQLLIAALGLGVIALFGRSASLAQLSFGLATALGGFMLWNWPVARYPFGAALLLGAGGALAATAYVLALYSETSLIAMAILLLCFFTEFAAKRVKLPAGKLGEALRPIVLAGITLIPALAAVAVAYIQSTLADSAPV
ncbi:MAG: hypothetical protein AB7P52_04700 [Alphaproteobacteria bacterium]